MTDKNKEDNTKSTTYVPDMSQLVKMNMDNTFLEKVMSILFDNNYPFNMRSTAIFLMKILMVYLFKVSINNPSGVLQLITSLKVFKYYHQKFYYGTTIYELEKNGDIWTYKGTKLSVNMLTSLMDKKDVLIGQPGTYYGNISGGYLVVYIVRTSGITIEIPSHTAAINFVDTMIENIREVMHGNLTAMYKCSPLNSNGTNLTTTACQIYYTYETRNYNTLNKMINSYYTINSARNFVKVPFSVIFNGAHGVGKTTFATYIAGKGYIDLVLLVSLVQYGAIEFETILNKLSKKIDELLKDKEKVVGAKANSKVLIMFDEIEKYLEIYTDHIINEMIEKPKQEVSKGEKTETIKIFKEITEEDIERTRRTIKNNFLEALLKMSNGESFISGERFMVYILNANNFEKIIENSEERHKALFKRFLKFQFSQINTKEASEFLKNVLLDPTEEDEFQKIEKKTQINTAIEKLPKDLNTSYRDLMQACQRGHFIPETVVDIIIENKNGDGMNFLKVEEMTDTVLRSFPVSIASTSGDYE